MDRDVAIQITNVLNNIKTGLQQLATNTTPSDDNRSVSPILEENQRTIPAEEQEEHESEPESEPVTKGKK